MDTTVMHLERENKFSASVDGEECVLAYEKSGHDTLDYKELKVPQAVKDEDRKKIKDLITEVALKYAFENELFVIPSDDFVRKYIEKHEKYKGIIPPAHQE